MFTCLTSNLSSDGPASQPRGEERKTGSGSLKGCLVDGSWYRRQRTVGRNDFLARALLRTARHGHGDDFSDRSGSDL